MSDECDLMKTINKLWKFKAVLENQKCGIYVTMLHLCIGLQFTFEVS